MECAGNSDPPADRFLTQKVPGSPSVRFVLNETIPGTEFRSNHKEENDDGPIAWLGFEKVDNDGITGKNAFNNPLEVRRTGHGWMTVDWFIWWIFNAYGDRLEETPV
jgi:hypothetical protein